MKTEEIKKELTELFIELVKDIDDDYCAFDDIEESETPSMQVTISTDNNFEHYNYQSGDNSYTGSCYGDPHWGVIYLMQDYTKDDCLETASEAIEQLLNLIHS